LIGVIVFRLGPIIPLDPFMEHLIAYGSMVRTKLILGC
jgi:hypothetical protein